MYTYDHQILSIPGCEGKEDTVVELKSLIQGAMDLYPSTTPEPSAIYNREHGTLTS